MDNTLAINESLPFAALTVGQAKELICNLVSEEIRKSTPNQEVVRSDKINLNDARKVISDLRHKDNWNIKDVRLDSGCKLYWLEPDGQPTLFAKGAGYE